MRKNAWEREPDFVWTHFPNNRGLAIRYDVSQMQTDPTRTSCEESKCGLIFGGFSKGFRRRSMVFRDVLLIGDFFKILD